MDVDLYVLMLCCCYCRLAEYFMVRTKRFKVPDLTNVVEVYRRISARHTMLRKTAADLEAAAAPYMAKAAAASSKE